MIDLCNDLNKYDRFIQRSEQAFRAIETNIYNSPIFWVRAVVLYTQDQSNPYQVVVLFI